MYLHVLLFVSLFLFASNQVASSASLGAQRRPAEDGHSIKMISLPLSITNTLDPSLTSTSTSTPTIPSAAFTATPGAPSGVVFDFTENPWTATWTTGMDILVFPGADGSETGFVYTNYNLKMEDGSVDSRNSLLMVPKNIVDGMIQGRYPAVAVHTGDHFMATIGCEFDAVECYTRFILDYQIGDGSSVQNLISYTERYEGMIRNIDIDLSALAGQNVNFILKIQAENGTSGAVDRAVWIAPRIVRTTLTPTADPTLPPTCDRAEFIADITYPNGSVLAQNTAFIKTWRIKNTGTCFWTTGYRLVYMSGESFGSTMVPVNLTSTVGPNTSLDISISLTTPATPGTYSGYWMLQNASAQAFGTGTNADQPWSVDIIVTQDGHTLTPTAPPYSTSITQTLTVTPTITPTNTSTPTSDIAYDFSIQAANAIWTNSSSPIQLNGIDPNYNGVVRYLTALQMEDGSTDPRNSLIMVPEDIISGTIQGVYPAYAVKVGDHFQSTLGCVYAANTCYVQFQLFYTIEGDPTLHFLSSFTERYEGLIRMVDMDLSALSGLNVNFILKVLALNSTQGSVDRTGWIAPRITNSSLVASNTPTPTPTSTQATATPTRTPTPTVTNTTTTTASKTPTINPGPGAFSKILPAAGKSTKTSVLLDWAASSGATGYEYCLDVTNDNNCSSWISTGTGTSKLLNGLTNGNTYFWQVRAKNSQGNTYANGAINAFWSFKVDGSAPRVVSILLTDPNPSTANNLRFTINFSEAVTGVNATDFNLTTAGVTNASVKSVSGTGIVRIVTINTGSGTGTIRLNVLDNNSILDLAGNSLAAAYNSGPKYTMDRDNQFVSLAASDGWVLETTELSKVGGNRNTSGVLLAGDDALNKEYRSILDFNTADLPDNAQISKVTLKLMKSGMSPSDPFLTLGALLMDMRKGYFGTNSSLESMDFQSTASKSGISGFTSLGGGVYQLVINPIDYAQINKEGATQFRLHFELDDNNNKRADTISFHSGNSLTMTYRPLLIVEYTLP